MTQGRSAQWLPLAVASGACAALNGVFAKLTTTGLTSALARRLAAAAGRPDAERAVDVAVRAVFFTLNLASNAVMWTLFTAALARGSSTAHVSVINTSANFVLTALLGLAIFAEALPPLWWAGAALVVAGNVIIGRKSDAAADAGPAAEAEAEPLLHGHGPDGAPAAGLAEPPVDDDVADLGHLSDEPAGRPPRPV